MDGSGASVLVLHQADSYPLGTCSKDSNDAFQVLPWVIPTLSNRDQFASKWTFMWPFWCIKHQGSSYSKALFDLASSHHLCITAQYFPGHQSICADTLSWFTMSPVEGRLHWRTYLVSEVSLRLSGHRSLYAPTLPFPSPLPDLVPSVNSGGLVMFHVRWDRWYS